MMVVIFVFTLSLRTCEAEYNEANEDVEDSSPPYITNPDEHAEEVNGEHIEPQNPYAGVEIRPEKQIDLSKIKAKIIGVFDANLDSNSEEDEDDFEDFDDYNYIY
ncbi:hypothetical protein O3M35_007095 [Rhynocoris fuscipes]|uniref:Uncharacterized protein n=1 Tax=Rhynocoris fuscipes TaxID=488301 RepID=A0AAW1D9I0_9HEMI